MPQPLTPPPMIARSNTRSKRRFPRHSPSNLAIYFRFWCNDKPKRKQMKRWNRAVRLGDDFGDDLGDTLGTPWGRLGDELGTPSGSVWPIREGGKAIRPS